MTPLWKKCLTALVALITVAAVIIPVIAYFIGGYMVGPYEGDGGLTNYLGTIYVAAGQGERAALTLILAPMLMVMIWLGVWLAWRRNRPRAKTDAI